MSKMINEIVEYLKNQTIFFLLSFSYTFCSRVEKDLYARPIVSDILTDQQWFKVEERF